MSPKKTNPWKIETFSARQKKKEEEKRKRDREEDKEQGEVGRRSC